MKGLVSQNQLILFTTVKKISEQSFFKKNYGTVGHTKIFSKSYNSAHTSRTTKPFSVFCTTSNTLKDDISFEKWKETIFPILATSASMTSQFVLLPKKIPKSFRSLNRLNPEIKNRILICCPNSFPTEVVGRSWWNTNQIHLVWSCL